MLRSLLFLVAAAAVAPAQIVQNTVTVTASANPSLQSDVVAFRLDVMSGIQTGLSDVLAALQGVGVTMANFAGIQAGAFSTVVVPAPPGIDWYFNLQAPISKMKDTVTALAALQQRLNTKDSALRFSFSAAGTTVSQQLQQSQTCSLPDLIASARTQAQALTNAAGLTLGGILAISGASTVTTGPGSSSAVDASPCSLTVKFAVLRYQ